MEKFYVVVASALCICVSGQIVSCSIALFAAGLDNNGCADEVNIGDLEEDLNACIPLCQPTQVDCATFLQRDSAGPCNNTITAPLDAQGEETYADVGVLCQTCCSTPSDSVCVESEPAAQDDQSSPSPPSAVWGDIALRGKSTNQIKKHEDFLVSL